MIFIKQLLMSLLLLGLSAQTFAVLNPDPDTKRLYWNSDGSGVLRTLTDYSGLSFVVRKISVSTDVLNCLTSTDTQEGTTPIEYVRTFASCGTNDLYLIPGTIVDMRISINTIATGYTLCIDNICDNDGSIGIGSEIVDLDENTPVGTRVIKIETTGTPTLMIQSGNSNDAFELDSEQYLVVKTPSALDYESTNKVFTLKIKASKDGRADKIGTFTVNLTDVNDNPPTDIKLSTLQIPSGSPADTVVATIQVIDADTVGNSNIYLADKLNNDKFKIVNNNQLALNEALAVGSYRITLTANNGAGGQFEKEFTLTVLSIAPSISKFTLTQTGGSGRVIKVSSANTTVSAVINPTTADVSYQWSGDFSASTGGNTSPTFKFITTESDIGTKKITLKVTNKSDTLTSERTLYLKVVAEGETIPTDADSNGIADSLETGHQPYELKAGTDKNIKTTADKRILLGVMGDNSALLTLAQMKKYLADNNLADNTQDTGTTDNIYDYVIEDVPIGQTANVIIELKTAMTSNAMLRKYAIATGWANFVVDTDNIIQSKIDPTCSDNNWQTGLVAGGTCLKLTIKDGGENDTDGKENGVIADPVAVAVSSSAGSSGGGGGGGGCVYNPNAPARFDIVFILLLLLSGYYFRTRFSR